MLGRWKTNPRGLEYVINLREGFILAEDKQMIPFPDANHSSERIAVPAFHLLKIHQNYPFKLIYTSKSLYAADLIPMSAEFDDLADIPIGKRKLIYDVASLFLVPRNYSQNWKGARIFELEKGFINEKLNEPISLIYLANGIEICIGARISIVAPPEIRKRFYNFLLNKQEIYGYTNILCCSKWVSYGVTGISDCEGLIVRDKLVKIFEKRFRMKIFPD